MKTQLSLIIALFAMLLNVGAQTARYESYRPSTDDWSIERNGEHLEIREPEHSNKLWAKFTDDQSFHLSGTPNLLVDGYTEVDSYVKADRFLLNDGTEIQGSPWISSTAIDGTNLFYQKGTVFITSDGMSNPGLVVEGKIEAEEIEVKDIGADYVFENDYKLLPLLQVEEYIINHKHLPGIEPAEITEKGVELGAFSEKLLEKIEELTLYQIELLKRIEQQEKEIFSLKKKIE